MAASCGEPAISCVPGPHGQYEQRLAFHHATSDRLARRYLGLVRARNGVLGLIVALAVLADKERIEVKVTLLALPALVFVGSVLLRNRTHRAWQRVRLAEAFCQQRLARLEDRWVGTGPTGARYQDAAHPFAADLDLFGRGSLFELLCPPCSRRGEDTLAAWLRSPAPKEEVCSRQNAVAELAERLDLREDLAVRSAGLPGGSDLEDLAAWGSQAGVPPPRWAGSTVALLTLLAVAAVVGCWRSGAGLIPLLGALLFARLAAWMIGKPWQAQLERVEGHVRLLRPLAILLERLQSQSFTCPRLVKLAATLLAEGPPASRHLHRFAGLLGRAPFVALIFGRAAAALGVAAWQARWGSALARWLDALGEFEALGALAAFNHENATDTFPDVVSGGPCLQAQGLGHPLLPRNRCVTNDVRFDEEQSVLIVSGSNMAGKSTLLRSVGVNVVLALAGGTVRARRLLLSPLTVGATLRVQDSLQAGRSRFFAEVLRVRQLLHLAAEKPPLLFLLDELFGGTSSHDRRRGAEAVLRRLLEAGAIGLVTTHDLALTELAGPLLPRAVNVHFVDRYENGTLVFDYTLRPGVVPSSNGLALMRAVGIEV
jgi:hypothetical protein